jgi:DNA-binding winged helix-turn-helix (wHTH) protein
MPEPHNLVFGPFRLDLRDERLWRGPAALPLRPKPWAVLRCLVTQAGQLVTKDALLEAVWPDTAVSDAALTAAIRDLRRVLGDLSRTPQFIETVHGRGYRFIAPVSAVLPPERPTMLGRPSLSLAPMMSQPPLFVGRGAELAQLEQWWTTAQQGRRQVGMVVGEPGIGKTALVDALIAQCAPSRTSGSGTANASTTMGRGKLISPSWRPWDASAGDRMAPISSPCCGSTPRAGLCISRPCSPPRTGSASIPWPAASRQPACCGSSPKRWRCSPPPARWCSSWKICTGAIAPPWSGWRTWCGDATRRAS